MIYALKINIFKDISEFYEVQNTHILGEGISGQVRLCKHKSVRKFYEIPRH